MEFDNFDEGHVLGSNFLSDFREGAVREQAHGLMRESKRRCGAGQAPGETLNSACIKTVDDAQDSRENSNCARMDRARNSGIPCGQEKIFSCVQLIGVQWA
jgi:hypothetical protein